MDTYELLSDDIKTGKVTTCLYCHREITEVIDSVSGVIDWGDDGDFGCDANPINDAEGTGSHHPSTMFRQAGYRLTAEELLGILREVSEADYVKVGLGEPISVSEVIETLGAKS